MANIIDYQLQSGGLGAYDYTPMFKNGTATSSATANQLSTLLSVTGKGLLHKAIIRTVSGGGSLNTIKITIDGTVIYWHKANAYNDNCIGLIRLEDTFSTGNPSQLQTLGYNSSWLVWANTAGKQYPSPTLETLNDGVTFIPMPIKFNTSLLIEFAKAETSNPQGYAISYSLGS